jgi:hypothetical protein
MSRKLAIAAMAAVLMGTLLWGGCPSCSTYFMGRGAGGKQCCTHSGKCKDASRHPVPQADCNVQPVILPHAPVTLDHATVLFWVVTTAPVRRNFRLLATEQPLGGGWPPDLCLLHSILRI